MSLEQNKKTSMRAMLMWASTTNDKPEDVFAANYVNHQEPSVEGGVLDKDLEGWKELVGGYLQSFSNSEMKILMQIAEGDFVSTRWEITATHTGEFMEVASTGKTISWKGVQIDRYEGGMIAESWVDWDMYSFCEGLGLIGKP